MSQNKKIRVDPQELRILGTHFQHVSADIQQLVTDLRHATADLDTGAWTEDEAARLTARFAEAEAMGQHRATAHAELGDLLCRAADAFEEADTAPVEESMRLSATGWLDAPSTPWETLVKKMRELRDSVPIATMYVTPPGGLNMRTTPMIPEDDRDSNLAMDSKIPSGAQIRLYTQVPTLVTSGYEWGYVTYTDADGNTHSGWVAIQYLREPRPLDSVAVSSSGYDLIVRHEGMELELYNDPSNNCSIGVGHLVHLGPIDGSESESQFLEGITEEEAYELLERDLAGAQRTVRTLVTVPLTQNQYDALVSFVFNVGAGNFASSDLLEKLNQGDYESVPGELARWVYGSDGAHLPGLVRRRQEEGTLFAADASGE